MGQGDGLLGGKLNWMVLNENKQMAFVTFSSEMDWSRLNSPFVGISLLQEMDQPIPKAPLLCIDRAIVYNKYVGKLRECNICSACRTPHHVQMLTPLFCGCCKHGLQTCLEGSFLSSKSVHRISSCFTVFVLKHSR